MAKRFWGWLDRWWFVLLTAGCIGTFALTFLFFGEESYLTVQDNLDLFVAHFIQVMSHSDTWFAQGAQVPMLGGISRDCLSGEWNLYNILFAFLPVFPAYMTGYFLKIGIGIGSFVLLAKDIYKEDFAKYRGIAWAARPYGILPLFPAYGIAFASVPLAVLILRKIYFGEGKLWYAALFGYPFLSYFSYFGFFILAYLVCAVVILSVRDKKICGRLFGALFVLAAGYVCLNTGCSGRCCFRTFRRYGKRWRRAIWDFQKF